MAAYGPMVNRFWRVVGACASHPVSSTALSGRVNKMSSYK